METQACHNARHHVSECPLPEVPPGALLDTSYVVAAPTLDICDLLTESAAAIIADAGLPAMGLLTNVSNGREGGKCFSVLAFDLDGQRNPLDACSASGFGWSFDGVLREFSGKLSKWAQEAGLVSVETMEGSPALV